jgi:GAF domain-containing protein
MPKDEGAKVRDLEKRLAEALKLKAEALGQLQTRDRERVEAQEQQTATSEILRVISSSPTDVQPVFDAIAGSAMHLCEGEQAVVATFDGELMHLAALAHFDARGAEAMRRAFPMRSDRGSALGRAVLSKAIAHIPSLADDPEYKQQHLAQVTGFRAGCSVPILKQDRVIGAIAVARLTVGPFSDRQLALLQTFADQAVIAIENVRLFTELQEKNHALTQAHGQVTEALERQTATAEILRVIASSPTEYQPVFDTIVRTAGVVCGAVDAILWTIDGDELVVRAHHGPLAAAIGARQPLLGSVAGYAVRQARVVHVDDLTEADDFPVGRDIARRLGWRTTLSAPLLREGVAIGAILIRRSEMRPFSDQQIALLQTFADQRSLPSKMCGCSRNCRRRTWR